MGFFDSFKKKPEDKCVSFLKEADTHYSRAFQIKNAAGLDRYFERTCLSRLVERIRLSEKVYSGLDRYKHVTWRKVAEDTFIKEVRYDDVKISKNVSAPVGDSYDEEWKVKLFNDTFKVVNLRRLA